MDNGSSQKVLVFWYNVDDDPFVVYHPNSSGHKKTNSERVKLLRLNKSLFRKKNNGVKPVS